MKQFLDYASQKYYQGNPVIPDEVFDRLAEEHKYEYVGHSVQHGVSHYYPMWSLKKCYVGEKLIDLGGETVETPKLDGAAISLLYVEGRLVMALTRGDGKRGEDITEKAKLLKGVPKQAFKSTPYPVQVTGEVVAPKTISNARNYAAGALNLKSLEEFKSRNVQFIAYGIQVSNKSTGYNSTYLEDMGALHDEGFYNVYGNNLEEFPTDGKVFRLNSNEAFDRAGYTSSSPRGAFALKERQAGVVSTLLDVKWQVGRTGAVSPVAILKPVEIGGAVVSKATLHNLRYIRDLELEIGCDVEVERAGEIIPKVLKRIK